MFCDLVGSTALAEQLDPEELRELLLAYREVSAEVIRHNGGQIAKSFGDGLMVYFGYPIAHEDSPQRAIRAGLEILVQMQQLSTHLMQEKGVELPVRIGIHTGRAVVGEMGSGDTREAMDIVGDTPNIAARIQSIATPNTVAISATTYRRVQGYFECESLGLHTLKGISLPMEVYRVQTENLHRTRLEAATSGLTPFVGRERELESLLHRWRQVKAGVGQTVLLVGEAGMGKSRLVQVFKEQIAVESYHQRKLYCSPYYTNSAFYPLIEMLRGQRIGLSRDDSPDHQLAKLEQFLNEYETDLAEVVPLFASLLSIPLNERYTPLNLSPQAQKQKMLDSVLAIALALAEQKPLLIVVEDLHWMDPSSLELLHLLIDSIPNNRILLLCTARPAFQAPWTSSAPVTPINLTALPTEQTEQMVQGIAGGKVLPKPVLELVVAKSDRIPLFVEEMTKMVLESGWLNEGESAYELAGQMPEFAIPATLQDLLMSRLDQLNTVKEVAQLGATIGRWFSYELLLAVWSKDEATLRRGLQQLVDAQLLFVSGEGQMANYVFKHALIQEAAYESLLRSTRRQYHRQLAWVLKQQFPETVERSPELLAHHYTRAGLQEEAIHYWQLAGQKAVRSSAYVEAIGHLTAGLDVLKTLPDNHARSQQELDLQTTLGVALRSTKGYAAREVELVYRRAEELCQLLGETPQIFWARRGLWGFYAVQSEYEAALEVGHQLMSLARKSQDQGFLMQAHYVLGYSLFIQGELAVSTNHLKQAIALYNPDQHYSQTFLTGQDAGVTSRCTASLALCLSGFSEQALEQSMEAYALAVKCSHPFSLAYALSTDLLLQYHREQRTSQDQIAELIALATKQEFPYWLAWGNILQGRALAELGEMAGIAQMRQGLNIYQAIGTKLNRPYHLALLAEAHLKLEQVESGLGVLAEALEAIATTGERYWEAELYRLKGELIKKKEEEAEACFHRAIAISRRQGAKSLELRASVSLARLWQQQGKSKPARHLLAEIYGWFTEGFDTVDLQAAKTLLEEL